jgi:hypothetical protein
MFTMSITVSQAAGSRSVVAAITIPATGTGGGADPNGEDATIRAAFSMSRAGERVPPVSTSESSTTSAVPFAAPAASCRSMASLCSR